MAGAGRFRLDGYVVCNEDRDGFGMELIEELGWWCDVGMCVDCNGTTCGSKTQLQVN